MNFPTDWFSPLSPVKLHEELEPDILQVEQLLQHKQRSHYEKVSLYSQAFVGAGGEVRGVKSTSEGDS
jgi:hypothetical protein